MYVRGMYRTVVCMNACTQASTHTHAYAHIRLAPQEMKRHPLLFENSLLVYRVLLCSRPVYPFPIPHSPHMYDVCMLNNHGSNNKITYYCSLGPLADN